LLAHVIEPIYIPPKLRAAMPDADNVRRAEVTTRLRELADASGMPSSTETIVLHGDASEEIVSLAGTRDAGLIVIGLHSSGMMGPKMGSVTYRVLCMTRALVLALPPHAVGANELRASRSLLRSP
jgi:nucleotide-binding universal stress UspA family protein